ncbi:cation transporter [Novosphingobium resinovorum]|jgi:divalent metal cation (Fe/Co/Zn/Cd) transporter|uniref:Cation diffusion facilitator family transporter n=1 Tax=Novosphingobium resinovorum TaxID=158500 RepID=A0A031K1S3_9SPHN|nr:MULTISPECIES: cation transporter [Sphingomonadaceae]AOR76468.1 cobalt transporter [Novosphingobium resinovorum]EJU13457.1 cation diffusion facilitator family transporter [Sphingomonas sp. LH128]EZP83175.1 Cation diffusion facilitator family transporter [Novosphingobium resinovorum]MBF7011729.1 cation transporter [Novosphingobium sp. HR1a]WJM26481.1 cation transporter [Novosphingobium resinovorum]
MSNSLPDELRPAMHAAIRLEYWNLFWTATIIAVMGLVLGQSQTMKTAWVEDTLGVVPPIMFLIAAHMELNGRRSRKFPFGFERVNGLGFFVAAVALTAVGLLLLYNAAVALATQEHASVGSIVLLGHDFWLGWLMIAAQIYSLVPPMLIGRRELPLAEKLNDKLLHTDALMNKANWLTGAAGLGGIIGLGLGWWWADSLAAAIISLDVISDGVKALRSSTAELIDGAPRALSSPKLSGDALELEQRLQDEFPEATIRLRETGRLVRAEIHGVHPPGEKRHPRHYWPGKADRSWRLAQVGFVPPAEEP